MRARRRREAYALYCDDSGSQDDALRSVASISGPARVLLALERELRQVLKLAGMRELKWTGLRKRAQRLQAAEAFLELVALGAGAGALRMEVLLWRPSQQGRRAASRSEAQRLRPLYARLWSSAVRAWPPGRWNIHPDQRTGMGWQDLGSALKRRIGRGGGLRSLKEASSRGSACVQVADLLAGLARVETQGQESGVPAVRAKRLGLRSHFMRACARRGLPMREEAGLMAADRPRLSIRFLRRLPVAP
jgi:hypothetical protein